MSAVADFWRSDRLRKVLIWLGVAIILVCLPTIVFQQFHYNQVQRGYHHETIQILDEHTNTLAEVHALRAEVTKLVKLYGPALTSGQKEIIEQYTWIACSLSTSSPTKCGPPPTP